MWPVDTCCFRKEQIKFTIDIYCNLECICTAVHALLEGTVGIPKIFSFCRHCSGCRKPDHQSPFFNTIWSHSRGLAGPGLPQVSQPRVKLWANSSWLPQGKSPPPKPVIGVYSMKTPGNHMYLATKRLQFANPRPMPCWSPDHPGFQLYIYN